MKNTLAMKPRSVTQPTVFWLTASGTLAERMQQISTAIAGRAYELFEARGRDHGHDWEDWFRAESKCWHQSRRRSSKRTKGLRSELKYPDLQVKTWKCWLSQGASLSAPKNTRPGPRGPTSSTSRTNVQ